MSLTDTMGSLALATKGQYMTGVSTDLAATFVRPAGKPGDILKMAATVTGMGERHTLAPSRVNVIDGQFLSATR